MLYHTRLGGKDDWKDFVKPVLDSAALDYHVEAVKEFGQATKIASEIEKDEKEGPFDGILAMGNDIFIEVNFNFNLILFFEILFLNYF